jgi:nitrile hydratase
VNGVHDMGGMHGFGAVEREPGEPVFHHEWERRAFALTLAAGFLGRWNIDMSRFARERMPPADYLRSSYYEKWLWGLERLLEERGLLGPQAAGLHALPAAEVEAALANRRAARMDDALKAPRFGAGERVRALNLHPEHHTRLPRYVRGRTGVVARDHGVFIFPDEHAKSGVKVPSRCYSVRFAARELWGPAANPHDAVHVDLFDEYLEAA